ncbi:cadherin-related family member 3-like [Erpetoichthys calabaricus]|uniref:cadherin-related family member 3-like n=1 Tax=Erpetoichthys calabaricus TaxID=27687 RepID=UPI0022342A30|nr:cadherin-related family member 3-like [Erpetoichthys calabaricus]
MSYTDPTIRKWISGFRLEVGSNNKLFNAVNNRVSIKPKRPRGELVKLNCTDHDVDEVNREMTFCCLFAVGNNNNFGLGSNGSGQSVMLKKELQYDNPSSFTSAHEYSLSVIVRDTAFPFYQTTAFVIIEVIPEEEPSLVFTQSPYVFNISEASGGGTQIGRIQVKDQHLHLSNLTFSISSPPACPFPDVFWLDSLNGNLQLIMRPDWLQNEVLECVFHVTATYHGPQQLYSNVVKVIVYILPANVNPPVCVLSSNEVLVSVDTPLGDTILTMTCTDKDSGSRSMRYIINSGNVNNHFSLSPAAGTNKTNLVLVEPFVYSEGLDKIWKYRLIVYIMDDNLLAGVPGPKGLVQTGSVTITLDVYNPHSTTTPSTTQNSFIYMKMTKNSYSLHAWYVPFVIVVASVLLLGLLGYLIKHACCDSSPDASKELL